MKNEGEFRRAFHVTSGDNPFQATSTGYEGGQNLLRILAGWCFGFRSHLREQMFTPNVLENIRVYNFE